MLKKKATRSAATDSSNIERRIMAVAKVDEGVKAAFYGGSGTGKTTLSCSFPGPALLLDINDKGSDSVSDVKNLKVLNCETWDDYEQAYWYLKKKPGLYETVITDTITELQDLALRRVLEDSNREPGSLLTKKDWGEVSSMMKTVITNFRNLDMNVVFNAQDRIFNGGDELDDDDGQIKPEVGPRLMPSVATHLCASVSIVGNTFIREKIRRIKNKDKKIVEEKDMKYCLRIGPHAYYTTKVRKPKAIEVPAFIVDPTYNKLVEILEE